MSQVLGLGLIIQIYRVHSECGPSNSSSPWSIYPKSTRCILVESSTFESSVQSRPVLHLDEQMYCIKGIRYFPQKSTNLTCSTRESKYTPRHLGLTQQFDVSKYSTSCPGRVLSLYFKLESNQISSMYYYSIYERSIFQTFWKQNSCPDFLFFELETSDFGYLLLFYFPNLCKVWTC